MKNKLYIIGNGFDLAHGLPVRFDPDFRGFAERYGQESFWNLYQTRQDEIWSDFENLLGYPDFDSLEEIFDGYAPDYLSDRESDRDGMIVQVAVNGQLKEALTVFADHAEQYMRTYTMPIKSIDDLLDRESYYLSFNYTHTLEYIYGIPAQNVLHIHGEAGRDNMALGYPEGNFHPEPYYDDVRRKGRGPYAEKNIEDYINHIEDFYVRTAYSDLYDKCKSFYKRIRIDLLENFLNQNLCQIEEIIVYGHSCAIDFDYFSYLYGRYPQAAWRFFVLGETQYYNVSMNIIQRFGITRYEIIPLS